MTATPPGPPWAAAAQRIWLFLVHLALALPFLTVESCAENSVRRTLSGFAYYAEPALAPMAAFVGSALLVLLVAPWRGARDGGAVMGLALRGWLAGLAALVAALGPLVTYLFEIERVEIGYVLHGGGWCLLALAYTVLAARFVRGLPPASRPGGAATFGIALTLGAPVVFGLAAAATGSSVDTGTALLVVGIVPAAPLAIGGRALVRAPDAVRWGLRAAWWAAVLGSVALQALLFGGIGDF